MIKVECVSCKAPYELDPRRIPDKGMKMRCPKCGTSFTVGKAGAVSAAGAEAKPVAPPPPAKPAAPAPLAPPFAPKPAAAAPAAPAAAARPAIAAPFKGTLVGHQAVAPVAAPAPAAPPAPAPVAAPKAKTALGVAPAAAPAAAPKGSLAPPPAPPSAAAPGAPKPAIAPSFTPPSTAGRSAAARGAFGATMLGTGTAGAAATQPKGQPSVDLPAPRVAPAPVEGVDLPEDLPALKAAPEPHDLSMSRIQVEDLPAPKVEVDLPKPRAAGAPAAHAKAPSPQAPAAPDEAKLEVDLPAPKIGGIRNAAPRAEVDLPAPLAGNVRNIAPRVDLDLGGAKPAVGTATITGAAAFGDLDLPTPKGKAAPAGAPAPGARPAGPKLGTGGFGDLDLPAPKGGGVDLPAPKLGGVDLPAPKLGGVDLPAPKLGGVDLPAPKGVADLPAPRGIADLPAARGGADLPAVRGVADLPMPRADMDLPSPKPFGDLDLPTPKADAGFGELDLPATKDDLPMPKRDDESSFADLDLDLPDLPPSPASGRADPLSGIELPPPRAAANLVPPKEKTVQGMGVRAPAAADEANFGDVALEGDSDLPPSLMGDDDSSFSDLDLDDAAPSPPPRRPAPPPARAKAPLADEVEELDADELSEELGEEPYEGDELDGEFSGEEGEGEGGEDMEFGISGDAAERGLALPPEVLRRQRGEEFEAKQAERGRRTLAIVLRMAFVLILLGGGGAALTFTEYGVFGIYYWERWLPEAGSAQFARDAIEKAEKIAGSDTYIDAKRSLKELGEARGKAGLNRELLTRSLTHQALFIARFGDDANAAAHAAGILKRLEERSWKAPGMDLARAADALRRKQWREVDDPLGRARSQAPSDPYVELVAGEAALAQNKPDVAEKAFAKALQLGGGARAQWGLARIALRKHDLESQIAAVNDTLKLSPNHVEARIADAGIAWAQGKEERALHLLRVALGLEPTEEDQYLWSSKQGVATGYSLLGFIHESRGRLHPAREAYEQALSADPYRVEALLGSGRVLLREKRYSDAQARFEAALSTATKGGDNPTVLSGRLADVEAKLGIARALLALDRPKDAKDTLDELDHAIPNDPDIILSLGEAAQGLGNAAQAEDQFRKSIDLAPARFAGYLALSQFFVKKGDAGKASEILNEAASHVEETAEMRRMLGQSELARNKLESALHEFKRALELDPHDEDAMFGMATAYRKHGDLLEAQKQLEEIGRRDPGYAGLAEQSGLLFEARGEFDKAVQAYNAALEKDPKDNSMLLRLGAAQVSAGAFDAAEQTLAKVIREMPNSAEAEYFIGRVAFARGRTPDALTHFDRAVGLDGTRGEFHLYVARASLEMGNLGRTLEEVQAALNFDPNLGDAYWVRAMVRLRMGAVQDSLKDLAKALKLNPARTEAYAVQGDCYEQLRQLPAALAAYRTALEKDPTHAEWWYRTAMLQADSGNRGESEAAVKRALELGEKADPMPYWLPDGYRLSGENAEARGDRSSAIRLYRRYLEIASTAAIDRNVIQKKLKNWGVQLEEEQ